MNGSNHRLRRLAPFILIASAIVVIALFFISKNEAARGWLIAFSVFSQIVLGSLALLLLHNLTSTSWGVAFGGVLRTLLWGLPLLAIFFIAIALTLPSLYLWATSPDSVPSDVARVYLNPVSFWVRSVIAFAGWILFAALLLAGNTSRLAAALGLTFYGVSSYVFGFDWVQSVSPPFISSSFNAEMAIQALLAALATAALFAPSIPDWRAKSDLGGFILAGSLAVFYFELMSLIINWYGDLPEQAIWYLARMGPWAAVAGAAAIFGAAIPIICLLWSSNRASGAALRLIGISVLIGIALHMVWLLAPLAQPLALVTAAVSAVAMATALIAFAPLAESFFSERRPGYA
jgi:hypothetical protein